MKFTIYEETEEKEQEIQLRLTKDSDNGQVYIAIVDEVDGEELYAVLEFLADGTMRRCLCLSSTLGLQLDNQGRIKEVE